MAGTRYARKVIDQTAGEGWDAPLNDDLERVFDLPYPVPEVDDIASLPTANTNRNSLCMVVDYDGAGNPARAFSDGVSWFIYPLGHRRPPITILTGTHLALDTEEVFLCSGTWTLDLPTAVGRKDKLYEIKNTGAGTITIDPNASETVEGAATLARTAGQYARLISDNANWHNLSN